MQHMGLVDKDKDKQNDGEKSGAESSVVILFNLVDQDASGSLSIDEVLSWFLEVREMVRQRELEDRFMRAGSNSSMKSEIAAVARKGFSKQVTNLKKLTKLAGRATLSS